MGVTYLCMFDAQIVLVMELLNEYISETSII